MAVPEIAGDAMMRPSSLLVASFRKPRPGASTVVTPSSLTKSRSDRQRRSAKQNNSLPAVLAIEADRSWPPHRRRSTRRIGVLGQHFDISDGSKPFAFTHQTGPANFRSSSVRLIQSCTPDALPADWIKDGDRVSQRCHPHFTSIPSIIVTPLLRSQWSSDSS